MRYRGFAVFLFLLAVYALTYSGVFHSDDEMSVAAVAESLVQRGAVTIDQLRWNQDLSAGIGKYGLDGHLYAKYGWGASAAALPFYLAALILPPLGNVQAVMLLNAFVTALSGWLVFRSAGRLGVSERGAVALALLYGLATLAWVYAKYFFGEPLSGLGLLAAFYFLLCYRDEHRRRDLWWAGLALGAAVAAKSANLAAAPIFLLQLGIYVSSFRFQVSRFTPYVGRFALDALPLLLPLALAALIAGGYNWLRFGDALEAGYLPIERFSGKLQEGIPGLLLSPGRGLIFYVPLVWLLIPAFPSFWRRWRAEAIVVGLLAVSQTLLYASWHVWFGGWCWGPRFLVPILPFLVLALGPWLVKNLGDLTWREHFQPPENLGVLASWRAHFSPLKAGAILLIILSGLVQVLGLSIDFNRYLHSLLQQYPELQAGVAYMTVDDPLHSPLLGQMGLIGAQNLDFAWLRITDGVAWLDWRILAPALAFLLLAGAFLWTQANRSMKGQSAFLAVTLLAGSLALWQVSAWGDASERYGPAARDYQALLARVQVESRPGDTLLVIGPQRAEILLNGNKTRLPVYGLLQEKWPLKPATQSLLSGLAAGGGRLWLITEDLPNADSGYEHWLGQRGHKVAEEKSGPALMSLYTFPPPGAIDQPVERVGRTFGGQVKLEGYTIWPWPARPGEPVQVTLFWQAAQARLPNYRVSLNLIAADQRLIWQWDSDPAGGFSSTSTWSIGETMVDRRGFVLPAQTPVGEYRLGIAVYDPQNGQALSLEDTSQRLFVGLAVGR